MSISIKRIKEKAYIAFEEDNRQARDFLESNIDEIAKELQSIKVTEENFEDLFQEEIERYEEYLAIE